MNVWRLRKATRQHCRIELLHGSSYPSRSDRDFVLHFVSQHACMALYCCSTSRSRRTDDFVHHQGGRRHAIISTRWRMILASAIPIIDMFTSRTSDTWAAFGVDKLKSDDTARSFCCCIGRSFDYVVHYLTTFSNRILLLPPTCTMLQSPRRE